jgi:hypothetical protein
MLSVLVSRRTEPASACDDLTVACELLETCVCSAIKSSQFCRHLFEQAFLALGANDVFTLAVRR